MNDELIVVSCGIFANVLIGFGASTLWVTHGKYLADFIKSNPPQSGHYTSLFFMIFASSQILANFYNTLCLSIFDDPQYLFAMSIVISLVSLVIFNILPEPPQGTGKKEAALKPGEIFKELIKLFKDKRILSMYGLFAGAACANAIPQSLLVIFYSMFLQDFEFQDQLRISSQIMIMTGIGGIIGGKVIAIIHDHGNDVPKGAKRVSLVNLFLIVVVYLCLYLCNDLKEYGWLCYVSAFLVGSLDQAFVVQIQMLVSNYFQETKTPFAIVNVVKTVFISAIFLISSNIHTHEDFSLFWIVVGVFSIMC